MITILRRKENLLIGIPLLFTVLAGLRLYDNTIDIHLHDTMYVIAVWHVFFLLLILMAFYFLMHSFLRTRKWRNKRICDIHIAGTVFCLLVICIYLSLPEKSPPEGFTAEDIKLTPNNKRIAVVVMIVTLTFLLLQIFFLVYFIGGLITRGFHSR